MQSARLRVFTRGHPVCSSKENVGRFNKDESIFFQHLEATVCRECSVPPLFTTEVRNMRGSNRTGRKKTEGACRERKAKSLESDYRELETTFYMLCPFQGASLSTGWLIS